MKYLIAIVVVIIAVWYLLIAPNISFTRMPWYIRGDYFIIQWDIPDSTVCYRGYWSNDSLALEKHPFLCRQFKIEAPKKGRVKQRHIMRFYRSEDFSYNMYYKVFAFNGNGKYTPVELSFYDMRDIQRRVLNFIDEEDL